MSKDLFRGLLKPTAHPSRNGFDLGHKDVWSQKVGQLVPCCAIDMVKNDYVEIDLSSLIRTMPLQTASFLRSKIKFDFYFVPYCQIWHGWNSFNGDSDVRFSSAYKTPLYCPRFDLGNFTNFANEDMNNADTALKDVFGYKKSPNYFRMLDMLGYGSHPIKVTGTGDSQYGTLDTGWTPTGDETIYANPFRACAYQLVWYHYYRNSYYDTSDYLQYFNLDDLDTSTQAGATITNQSRRIQEIFTLRYHQYNKDIFTGSLPNTQYGAVSSVPTLSGDFNRLQTTGTDTPTDGSSHYHNISAIGNNNVVLNSRSNLDNVFNFDVLTLRKMQALQGWKQNVLRAGQNPEDRAEAIYGERSKYEMDNFPDYLGTFEGDLFPSEVTQTVQQSDASPLGQLGGKMTGVIGGKKIKYHSSDFGVIIGLCSVIPKSEYNAQMIDRNNQLLDREDFFIPDYDNLGLEPVTSANLNRMTIDPSNRNRAIGYAPRYWNYKTNVDKVHNGFMAYWADFTNPNITDLVRGPLSNWVSPRADVQYFADGGLTLGQYYVNPNITDTIFYQQAGDFDDSDTFLINAYFDIKAVRPMSVLGIPQF